ncbi:MAG: type IV pilus secretin PilQ [Polyangiales bacterium]
MLLAASFFAPRAASAQPLPGDGPPTERPASRVIARESAEVVRSDGAEEAGFLSTVPLQIGGARGNATPGTGRRIDIDLRDADIHNVLRLLAEVGNVNIVTSDDVSGNVTIRMHNVPWDRALEVILAARSLGMQRDGNIIRIAPQSVLDKERELAIERAKQNQQLEPLETRLVPVSYALGTEIAPRARELLSGRGSLSVDERTNVLIARDVAANLNQVEQLVRSLDTQTPQVLVEARIVEATSTFARDFGIQWGGDAFFGTSTGNPTGLTFPSDIGLVGGASDFQSPTAGLSPTQQRIPNPNFAVNLPATVGTGSGGALGLTLGSISRALNINVRLSAAESTGVLRIVSSPRILTLDNREALIAQGTLIPYSQVSAAGVQTAFQEAKLQLRVRPHVTADGSISLHVRVNRDEPDFNNTGARGDPTILRREAETDLLVQDGRTAVIGGIYTRNTGRNVEGIPVLGDIPVLGALFQRRRQSDRRTELLIFITPRIVNRAESLGR